MTPPLRKTVCVLSGRSPAWLGLAGTLILGWLLATIPAIPSARAAAALFVRQFHFEGNTVFSDAALQAVVSSFTGRRLTESEVEEARIQVSSFYIAHGYTNSGALLLGSDVRPGIVYFRIVEGKVGTVEVEGNRWFRDAYLKSQIVRGAEDPFNTNVMAENIATMRRNDTNGSIQAIDTKLQPGSELGDGDLTVRVKDRQPFRAELSYDNRRPAGVGAQEVTLSVADVNLTGYNDPLSVDYVVARQTRSGDEFSGKDNLAVSYARPLSSYDTSVYLRYSRADYTVVSAPFQDLGIDSNERVYTIGLRQPIIERKNLDLALSVQMDREESHTFLLGVPFTLSPGAIDGTANLTALRFIQDFTLQRAVDVLAVRSTFSFGTTLFGGTQNGSQRDANFVSWRGEGQYVRKLFKTDNLIVLRANGQVTDDPLLELEQYSIGGRFNVRGYRENELVRDDGYFVSAEFRIPLYKSRDGEPVVQLAPFGDLGGGFNKNTPTVGPRYLASVGVGLLVTYKPYFYGELYYGYGLRSVSESAGSDHDLQDDGIHFFVQVAAF